jgi:hypothetical protein
MTRERIIREIKRTAEANGGRPLGVPELREGIGHRRVSVANVLGQMERCPPRSWVCT